MAVMALDKVETRPRTTAAIIVADGCYYSSDHMVHNGLAACIDCGVPNPYNHAAKVHPTRYCTNCGHPFIWCHIDNRPFLKNDNSLRNQLLMLLAKPGQKTMVKKNGKYYVNVYYSDTTTSYEIHDL